MGVCGKMGEMDKAIGLLDEMKKEGVAPNAITFNTLLSHCIRKQDLYRTKIVLQKMDQYSIGYLDSQSKDLKEKALRLVSSSS